LARPSIKQLPSEKLALAIRGQSNTYRLSGNSGRIWEFGEGDAPSHPLGVQMKTVIVTGLCALGLSLSGCASVVQGQSQTIAITTPPTTGAECTLKSALGSWNVTSPGTVKVQRSKENVEIRCNKAGFQEGYSVIPSEFEGWTVGNLLIGGIIGIGVDAATGAINQYPNAFQVPMYPLPAAPTASAPAEQLRSVSANSPTS